MSRFIGGRLTEKVYLLEIREDRRDFFWMKHLLSVLSD